MGRRSFRTLRFCPRFKGPRVFPPVASHGGVRVSPVPLAWVVVYFVFIVLTLWWCSADGFFFTFLGALSCWNGWSVALDRWWFTAATVANRTPGVGLGSRRPLHHGDPRWWAPAVAVFFVFVFTFFVLILVVWLWWWLAWPQVRYVDFLILMLWTVLPATGVAWRPLAFHPQFAGDGRLGTWSCSSSYRGLVAVCARVSVPCSDSRRVRVAFADSLIFALLGRAACNRCCGAAVDTSPAVSPVRVDPCTSSSLSSCSACRPYFHKRRVDDGRFRHVLNRRLAIALKFHFGMALEVITGTLDRFPSTMATTRTPSFSGSWFTMARSIIFIWIRAYV